MSAAMIWLVAGYEWPRKVRDLQHIACLDLCCGLGHLRSSRWYHANHHLRSSSLVTQFQPSHAIRRQAVCTLTALSRASITRKTIAVVNSPDRPGRHRSDPEDRKQ